MRNQLLENKTKLAVVGLGYVGMPLAVEFSKHIDVIGFDINSEKVKKYLSGEDPTKEVGDQVIKSCNVHWTSDETKLKECSFIIVAVPTPIKKDTTPDLFPVISSSEIVGRNLKKGAIVVFESTVYPGVTEEICVPIIEKASGLKCGSDFKIGYSPERINPSDKVHTLTNIKKIVSGMDKESLEDIANVYSIIIKAGVYKAQSIKVAEAAKVIENSQRDINIAFMNELSIIFNKMGIDTLDVLEAAGTKWNFLPFRPGLVGGHCIGVDPYYLTYRAKEFGYHSKIILSGRELNDGMGKYIAELTVKKIISENCNVKDAKVGILGFTFKENCPDVRNTKIFDIYSELLEYGIKPIIYDPEADYDDAFRIYKLNLVTDKQKLTDLDVLIIAVAHDAFLKITKEEILSYFNLNHKPILMDIKGILNKEEFINENINYWRL